MNQMQSLTLGVHNLAGEASRHGITKVLRGKSCNNSVECHLDHLLGEVFPEQRQQEPQVLFALLLYK